MEDEESKYSISSKKVIKGNDFFTNALLGNAKKKKNKKKRKHSAELLSGETILKKLKIEENAKGKKKKRNGYVLENLSKHHKASSITLNNTNASFNSPTQNEKNVKDVSFDKNTRKSLKKKKFDLNRNEVTLNKPNQQSILEQRQNLPIYCSKNKIVSELKKFETTIIIGETGSGKTTQIPQFIHEHHLDNEGAICITQPRRVAAITIAERVAQEMNCKLGSLVGYSVRFEERHCKSTKIKYVTDGMLLREAISNPFLMKYKWIILDEAHERSINTDILFGVVKEAQRKRKLKKRIPLRIVIMSATMDVDNFSSYFNDAPVLYVEGRQHKVEVFAAKKKQSDYTVACLSTMLKIHKRAKSEEDILIFLTGQEEIDGAVKIITHISKDPKLASLPSIKAYPLYAALPHHKQLKVFGPPLPGERKVIVSTNIAETSVTIPGIKYVIDCGHVKVRTYNSRSGFDDLKVCKISQAQAWQRTGRAGRESPGFCYRTYTNEEFQNMSVNTVPEILRANLASVLLKLLAIGIKNVMNFDFIDKPTKESLQQAQMELLDLKAIKIVEAVPVLTKLGRKMSLFPLEPQYAKLLINGPTYSCTSEILTIIAVLSSESVYVNPSEKKDEAREKREKFTATEGDHITLLNIYNAFTESTNKKIWCRKNYLNMRNLSYATEVRRQLEELCRRNDVSLISSGGMTEPVLKCLISVLYKNVAEVSFGAKYKILRTTEFAKIHPSSTLFGRSPDYILFTELVKTGKTFMHLNLEVKAEWLMEFNAEYFRSKHMRKAIQ